MYFCGVFRRIPAYFPAYFSGHIPYSNNDTHRQSLSLFFIVFLQAKFFFLRFCIDEISPRALCRYRSLSYKFLSAGLCDRFSTPDFVPLFPSFSVSASLCLNPMFEGYPSPSTCSELSICFFNVLHFLMEAGNGEINLHPLT
jgi:hypothetical protein